MSDAVAALWSSGSAMMAISGEPGIGKSRLLAELGAMAEEGGCLALSGRAGEFERGQPFAVFRDALDDYVGSIERRLECQLEVETLGELAPVLPSVEALGHAPQGSLESERYRAHQAVRELLGVLAVPRPLVLVLDDVHWADESSLELLSSLVRRGPKGQVLVACALRPRQSARWLLETVAHERVVGIDLGPLDLDGARALLGTGLEDRCVQELHRVSGGVPFYLEELARSPGWAEIDGPPEGIGAGAGLPAAVALALQGELATLSSEAAVLLRGAAVAGDPFELSTAAAAAGVTDSQALDTLDQLVERDLVRPTEIPRRLRFRHPLVRHAVYELASPGFRIAAHERVAESLGRGGVSALVRAHHVAASAKPGDRDAVALLAEAGHAAAARSPAVASRWFEEALRLLRGGDHGQRLELLAARARALAASGALDEALEVLREALALAPVDARELRFGLVAACAGVENILGRHGEATARLRAALDATDDPGSVEAATLQIELGVVASWASDFPATIAAGAPALAAARALGDRTLEALALTLVSVGETHAGQADAAAEHVAQAGALFDSFDDEQLAARVDLAIGLGYFACFNDRFVDSLRWIERGIAVARRIGHDQVLVSLVAARTYVLVMLGRLSLADESAWAGVESARLGHPHNLSWALALRCWVSALSGELPGAARAGEECVALLARLERSATAVLSACLVGEALVAAGEPSRARSLILDSCGGEDLDHMLRVHRPGAYELLTRAALALDRHDEANAWAARAARTTEGLQTGATLALARMARAAVLLGQGDPAGAATAALHAAVCAGQVSARLHAARARLLAGRALAAAGHADAAVTELEHAAADLGWCGAMRLRDEAASELRALGRRAPTVPRGAGPHNNGNGIGTLSSRENEVAELVSAGRANKEIAAALHITVNTVETHLKRIYSKLGVQNRAALAAVLERERQRQPA